MPTLAAIGLGSNLGDREAILDAAVASLASTPGLTLIKASRYYETPPIGGPTGQGAFLNAALTLDSTLDAFGLHRRLAELEHEAGRTREVRWGARSLDLDLLLYGDEIVDSTELTIPHLRLAVRRFVLEPLAEIAPDFVEPLTKRIIKELLANLDRLPRAVGLSECWSAESLTRLANALPRDWLAITIDSQTPDTLPIPTFIASPQPRTQIGRLEWPKGVPILNVSQNADEAEREIVAACEACAIDVVPFPKPIAPP